MVAREVIHGKQISAGNAKVGVEQVEKEYMALDLDIPGGDGEKKLGEAIHGYILWLKRYIVIPGTPRPPPSPHQPHK